MKLKIITKIINGYYQFHIYDVSEKGWQTCNCVGTIHTNIFSARKELAELKAKYNCK